GADIVAFDVAFDDRDIALGLQEPDPILRLRQLLAGLHDFILSKARHQNQTISASTSSQATRSSSHQVIAYVPRAREAASGAVALVSRPRSRARGSPEPDLSVPADDDRRLVDHRGA